MKFTSVLMATIFYVNSAPVAFAAPKKTAHSGKSEAEFNLKSNPPGSATMTLKNTEFRFGTVGVEVTDPTTKKTHTRYEYKLYEIKKSQSFETGGDMLSGQFTINSYDAKSNKKLWTIEERANDFDAEGNYFVARTSQGGSCTTTRKLFNIFTGKPLLRYTFASRITLMPIVLRVGITSESFRFLAYHDYSWSCGEHGKLANQLKGTALAGIISYASPEKVIQKIAVLYVGADLSDDPTSVELLYKDSSVKFTGFRGDSAYEFDYWWRKVDNDPKEFKELGGKIFSDIRAKFNFGDDFLEIPLENDRLNILNAKKGKQYISLVEISESDWPKF